MYQRPPRSTHVPYTTLFRSGNEASGDRPDADLVADEQLEAVLDRATVEQLKATLSADTRRRLLQTFEESLSERACHRSEEHTSELQSQFHLVCRLLLEKKKE